MPVADLALLHWPGWEHALEIAARLIVAALGGAALGINREALHRAAGLRTHMLVALGCALFVLSIKELSLSGESLSRVV